MSVIRELLERPLDVLKEFGDREESAQDNEKSNDASSNSNETDKQTPSSSRDEDE